MGEILKVNAQKFGDKLALKDSKRQLSFKEYNSRSCMLANGFIDMGLKKGDRLAVISTNCLEFMEIYAAVAKAGIVVVPINWRLAPRDMQFIINNSDAKAVIVRDEFVKNIEIIRKNLPNVPEQNFIFIGDETPEEYTNFEDVVSWGGGRKGHLDTSLHFGNNGNPKRCSEVPRILHCLLLDKRG
jgi:acyl-CoA synthetase (AMP-forming)/AMP-acid ligase II